MRNQLIALLLLSATAFGADTADTRKGSVGVGILLGQPSALTARAANVQFGLGYYIGSYLFVYGDLLWRFPGALKTQSTEVNSLVPYVGVGAHVGFATGSIALRIPFGLSWMIPSAPIELFLELAPHIVVFPGVFANGNGGLGARYFF